MSKKRASFKLDLEEVAHKKELQYAATLHQINELLNVFIPKLDKEKLISKMKSEEELIEVCKYLNLNSSDITKSILNKYGV